MAKGNRNDIGVIFDMDGVLIDSEPVHIRLERRLFDELGIHPTQAEHESFLGTSGYEMFSILKERYKLKESVESLLERERAEYLSLLASAPLPLVPGVSELVEHFIREGIGLALASSAPHEQINLVMERSGFGRHFTVRISGDDVTRSKPDPAIFLKAAGEMNSPPASCWVIEDSTNGVTAARAAGMRCIGYQAASAPVQDLSEADFVIGSILDASELVT